WAAAGRNHHPGSPTLNEPGGGSLLLLHLAIDAHRTAGRRPRHDVALDGLAVHGEPCFGAGAAVLHANSVVSAPAFPRDRELGDLLADARIDEKPLILRTNTEHVARDGHEIPRRGAGEPRVLRLSMPHGVFPRDHLGIDVRLGAMDFADILEVGRGDF